MSVLTFNLAWRTERIKLCVNTGKHCSVATRRRFESNPVVVSRQKHRTKTIEKRKGVGDTLPMYKVFNLLCSSCLYRCVLVNRYIDHIIVMTSEQLALSSG